MQSDKEAKTIKIAIKVNNETHLHDLPKTHTLQGFINDVCQEHEKNTKISWGFKFNHTVGLMDNKLTKKYVTESNFREVQDGCILIMVPSIDFMLKFIFVEFDPANSKEKMFYLDEMCDDISCIEQMKQNNQHNEIPKFAVQVKGDDLENCLKSLNKIIFHGVIPSISSEFIEFLVKIIKSGDHVVNTIHSMELLTQLLNVNANFLQVFKDQLQVDDLMPYFWRDENLKLQLNTLALLNNIVDNSSDTDKDKFIKEMKSDKNRNIIFKHVICNGRKDENIAHQLHVYQTHVLSTYSVFLNQDIRSKNDYADILDENESNRRNTMIDFEEKQVRSRTNTISSESSNELLLSREQSIDEMDDAILRNKSQSLQSISSIIILSHLTINCMEYYRKKYQKNYTMSVLEAQYYPGFYTICDQIVRMLCDILHIGKERDKHCSMCVPIIFYPKEKSPFFEELFCRAVWLLAKTRREMKARVDEDHEKVLNVLKEQIHIALKSWPLKYTELTNKLKTVSHKEVFDIWEIERSKKWEESLQMSPSIKELKTKMLPDIEELIRQQRMQVLRKGECFPRLPEKRGKQHYWYIYLTPNNQKFLYGGYDPDTQKYTSQKSEIAVSEIAYVVIGKASPHVKDHRVRRIELFSRCFSLFLKDEGTIDFLAHDETTAQYWIDGLHLLLGKSAVSDKYRTEKDVLLNMEVNLHLLDLQNIPLPKEPPVVPSLPPGYLKPALPPKSPSLEQAIQRRTHLYTKQLNIY